ncbi:hypothetical protein [Granulicatella seriolae]|uniref:Uncharacterized protein n=1 Tax=Granulicatella seriolae TaxID=2967226 RepID=A0ABT1WSB7_9LACT|nr:hypothetical protein [Granulicatella seriolae]
MVDATLSEEQIWKFILALKNNMISFEDLKKQLSRKEYKDIKESFILSNGTDGPWRK